MGRLREVTHGLREALRGECVAPAFELGACWREARVRTRPLAERVGLRQGRFGALALDLRSGALARAFALGAGVVDDPVEIG